MLLLSKAVVDALRSTPAPDEPGDDEGALEALADRNADERRMRTIKNRMPICPIWM
jgi:hypothetical protein